MKIDQPEIQQKLFMMSLTLNQNHEPTAIVYSKVNVVDGYKPEEEFKASGDSEGRVDMKKLLSQN